MDSLIQENPLLEHIDDQEDLPYKDDYTLKEISKVCEEETDCTICLDSMESAKVVEAPCHRTHKFHTACLDIWLTKSNLCPICRTRIARASYQLAGKTRIF